MFCTFGPNLPILAWTDPELSRGQASDWHILTHTKTQAMTTPEGRNWPRVKEVTGPRWCIAQLWHRWEGGPSFVLQWCLNERDGVSNHQPHDCLLNRLFRRRSKNTSKLHVNGLCAGNPPVSRDFPAQMASDAENVYIWWRHHRPQWILVTPCLLTRIREFIHTQRAILRPAEGPVWYCDAKCG